MKFAEIINNNYRTFLCFFLAIVLFGYYGFSCQFEGPAYLSDEIGYLTKAIALAGHSVDMASSWHGGAAFVLAPLFLFFSDPFAAWKGVLAVNAVMWAFSYYLLFYLLTTIFPEKTKAKILAAVLFVTLYPSWVIMSGYAFSTTAIVTVFMISIVALTKINKTGWLFLHSLATGFVYWIHPTGAAIAIASVIVVILISCSTRKFKAVLVNVIILASMIGIYKFGVHPWFNTIMTPDGFTAHGHYKPLGAILDKLKTFDFYVLWFVTFCGHVSSLLICTFGLPAYVFSSSISTFLSSKGKTTLTEDRNREKITLFAMLATLGVAALGSLSFSTSDIYRIDLWIYNRYAEVALIPLLGIALLIKWRKFNFLIAVSFLFIAGLLVHNHSIGMTNSVNNLVNIQSFWPQAIYKQGNLFLWSVIGIIGVAVIYYLPRKLSLTCIALVYALAIQSQAQFHKGILKHYSNPSGIVDLIYSNFASGSSVGFDTDSENKSMHERRNLYAYYLFPYQFQRMTPEVWISTNDGVFLTHSVNSVKKLVDQGANLIAREDKSNLFLLFNKDKLRLDLKMNQVEGITLATETDCILNGCYSADTKIFARYKNTGEVQSHKIVTNKKAGYLFYGPYRYLEKGSYLLKVRSNLFNGRGAVIDIVSDKGKVVHDKLALSEWPQTGRTNIVIPFELSEKVTDLEVRLRVGKESDIEIFSYSIVQNSGKEPSDFRSPALRMPADNIVNSQVGKFDGKNLVTTSKSGFLAYGPYAQLTLGMYSLEVTGSADNIDNAYIDVVSDRGRKTHAMFELADSVSNKENILLSKTIQISQPISDVEVRVWVGENDKLTLSGYTLTKVMERNTQ